MTTTGQLTAKPPVSPHANLTAISRIDTAKFGSAIWQLACTCGLTLTADAPAIKRGSARCPACNPRRGVEQANKILAVLPAAYAAIERKTKLTRAQIEYRIDWMRERELCHIGDWDRADQQGSFGPIFHAGKGEDVPCKLKPRTRLDTERRYRKRVQRAIKKATAGGKEDPRYSRQISLHKANETARRTRREPQGPFSALFVVAKQGRAEV